MKILAFETCFGKISLGLYENGKTLLEKNSDKQSRQAELLFPLIEETLSKKKLSYSDLGAIAVSVGPGSFTGVRIGLAAAQGICFAAKLPLVGVTTLEAAAYNTAHKIHGSTKIKSVFVALDASREQLYIEEFVFFDNEPKIKSVEAARLVDYSDLINFLPEHEFIFAGNAAKIIDSLAIKGKKFTIDETSEISAKDIAAFAELKMQIKNADFSADKVTPFYIREPDAKLPKTR